LRSIERLTQVYDYEGPREAAGIVAEMERHADPAWTAPVNAVIDLTEESFDTVVAGELVLVEFFAPW
jgi:hypothetical protein